MISPLVSVIVPVYNVEKYLNDCIEGIINQTYKNIEIILIDDGSQDASGSMCDYFCSVDNRINVIHQTNMGLSAARNAGIMKANGEYLCFVDSDDMVRRELVEHLIKPIIVNLVDFSCCGSIRCEECDTAQSIIGAKEQYSDINMKVLSSEQAMNELIKERTLPVTAWGKLYSRELFKDIMFPVGKYNEDAFTTYRIINASRTIGVINTNDYIYRKNNGSIMRSSFKEKRFDIIEAKKNQLEFIRQHYPALEQYAESSIVASCNECVFDMGTAGYSHTEKEKEISILYHNYLRSYLRDHTSPKGKAFAILASCNVQAAKKTARLLKTRKPKR